MNRNNNDFLSQSLSVLTPMELGIILGTLLGDSHLQKRGNSYRLKIEHSSIQKEYLYWKYEKLIRLCGTTQPPRLSTHKTNTESYVFYTSSGKWLEPIYNLFYVENQNGYFIKTITPALIKALPVDPVILAVLHMDDGSVRNDCYAGKLGTMGFTKMENNYLCDYLRKFGVEGKVVLNSKKRQDYYISLPAKTFGVFANRIRPIVSQIPSMVYKLNDARRPGSLD